MDCSEVPIFIRWRGQFSTLRTDLLGGLRATLLQGHRKDPRVLQVSLPKGPLEYPVPLLRESLFPLNISRKPGSKSSGINLPSPLLVSSPFSRMKPPFRSALFHVRPRISPSRIPVAYATRIIGRRYSAEWVCKASNCTGSRISSRTLQEATITRTNRPHWTVGAHVGPVVSFRRPNYLHVKARQVSRSGDSSPAQGSQRLTKPLSSLPTPYPMR